MKNPVIRFATKGVLFKVVIVFFFFLVVVLNKFLTLEGRINTLGDLLPQLEIEFDALTRESQKLYEELMAKPAGE